jgi:hypothetical protein
LAGGLQTIFPLIIRSNQTGFVEGWSILDNTFLAREALNSTVTASKTWYYDYWTLKKYLTKLNGVFFS